MTVYLQVSASRIWTNIMQSRDVARCEPIKIPLKEKA